MEHYSNPLNPLLGENEASKKQFKQKSFSRKTHRRSTRNSKLHTLCKEECCQIQAKENTYSSDESVQYIPAEEQVLRKLKRERKLLKKWTVELNRAKSEIDNSNADEFSPADSKISEIQKRYHILLPAIKLAMHAMDQAILSKASITHDTSSLKNGRQGNDQSAGNIEQSFNEDMTDQGLAERTKARWLKESKEHPSTSTNLKNPDSANSLMTDISKQQYLRRAAEKSVKSTNQCISEKPLDNRKDQGRKIRQSLKEDMTSQVVPEKKRARGLKESKEQTLLSANSNLKNPDSRKAVTDISKQHLARQTRAQYIDNKKVHDVNIEAMNEIKASQSLKQTHTRHVKESNIQLKKPGANGEVMVKMNVRNLAKQTALVNSHRSAARSGLNLTGKNVLKENKQDPVNKKNHSNGNFRKIEQNVLCTGPNMASQSSSVFSGPSVPGLGTSSNDLQCQASSKSDCGVAKNNNSEERAKCKCKDKKNSKPCICKCFCEEESSTCDSKISLLVLSSTPSSSGEDGRAVRKTTAREKCVEPKSQESVQVQTSFPSSVGPCKPETCPKRQKRFVENREIEVQTDDTDIEWQYEPPMTEVKRNVVSAFKIPPKRTATMDDRLLRRIMYFDSHQTSVCNKNVQFCTYNVHQTKKDFPKGEKQVPCADCPGSRKCKIVLTQHPYHLTCNEIVVEVKSLELNQEGVDSLMKVCSFLYIDYVFLGHVGNETNLAPVSSSVLFDSRKTYSVSLRFNKKERSILREQCNPSGLLAKDSIMFIVVCQAAPDFDINKNWDFGFGYLSMKQIGEQIGPENETTVEVEMQKIGGTKNNIGRLLVSIEGLETIKSIMNEELRCIEPQVDAVMKKLSLNKKEVIAMENNQTTCTRKTAKN